MPLQFDTHQIDEDQKNSNKNLQYLIKDSYKKACKLKYGGALQQLTYQIIHLIRFLSQQE